MNVIKILKNISAPILCVLTLNFINFWLMPIVFCAILIALNLKKFKFEKIIKFTILSYLSFICSILLYLIIGNILEFFVGESFSFLSWRITDMSLVLSASVIAPILFYKLNSFIFKGLNIRDNLLKIIVSVFLIAFGMILNYSFDNKIEYSFMLWQFTMAFILQLLFNSNKLLIEKNNL